MEEEMLATFDGEMSKLREYPAKDIINSLTMTADRCRSQCGAIVHLIEQKIRSVPSTHKLPIFYLIDSIMKNIGRLYVDLFSGRIVDLYSGCVAEVSPKDLLRFLHVLKTWEKMRLFPLPDLRTMRAAAENAQNDNRQKTISTHSTGNMTNKNAKLRTLLTKMQSEMGLHPTQHMSLEDVQSKNPEFLQQLMVYAKQQANQSTDQPNPIEPSPQQQQQQHQQQPPKQQQQANRPFPIYQQQPAVSLRPQQQQQNRQPLIKKKNGPLPQKGPVPAAPAAKKSTAALQLMQRLRLKKQRTDNIATPAPAIVAPNTTETSSGGGNGNTPDAAAVLSLLQKLKTLDKNKVNIPTTPMQPNVVSNSPPQQHAVTSIETVEIKPSKERNDINVQSLYAALPLICPQSGLRFKDQEKLDKHLDFLFHYNRAQKEKSKGGSSRSWYPNDQQWATDFSTTENRGETSSHGFENNKSDEDDNEVDTESRVPVDDSVYKCRICGDTFAKIWDEEEEEWMYRNAVIGTIQDDSSNTTQQTIFHQYCYNTVTKSSAKKMVLKSQLAPGTPTLTTTTTSSLKRPVEDQIKEEDPVVKKSKIARF